MSKISSLILRNSIHLIGADNESVLDEHIVWLKQKHNICYVLHRGSSDILSKLPNDVLSLLVDNNFTCSNIVSLCGKHKNSNIYYKLYDAYKIFDAGTLDDFPTRLHSGVRSARKSFKSALNALSNPKFITIITLSS